MTKFTLLTLLATLTATPCLAQETTNTRGETRQGGFATAASPDESEPLHRQTVRPGTRRLTFQDPRTGDPMEMNVDEASHWADTVCAGDSILIFDYHEDGSVDESSYDFDCLADL